MAMKSGWTLEEPTANSVVLADTSASTPTSQLRSALEHGLRLVDNLEEALSLMTKRAQAAEARAVEIEKQVREVRNDEREIANRLVESEEQMGRWMNLYVATYQLHAILDLTTGHIRTERQAVLHREDILRMQSLVRRVPVARHVQDYAIRVVQGTHPDGPDAPEICKRFVRFGASPRGAQSVLLAAKIRALFEGRFAASVDDVRAVALPALRHRVLLNFEGEAEGTKTDQVIEAIVKALPETKAGKAEAQVGLS